jgi:signal transduction histidine kinase
MAERQITETQEPASDPTCVDKDLGQGWNSDDTKAYAIRTVTLYPGSENRQEAISTIGWLSASILHDLRNPLGTIVAGAEMLMDPDSHSAQVKRLAANMYRAAGRMQQLLADLASIARGNVSTAEICDVREVVAAASEATLTAIQYQSVQILLDVPERIDLFLVRSHIERVFFNLIANAVEAMPGGGMVHIRARKGGTCVLVELEDTGPGIPGCVRDRLFEPFVTSGKQDGLGLGLALARQTVRNCGGDIWTEPAAGTRFIIRLPLCQTECVPRRAAFSENVSTGN